MGSRGRSFRYWYSHTFLLLVWWLLLFSLNGRHVLVRSSVDEHGDTMPIRNIDELMDVLGDEQEIDVDPRAALQSDVLMEALGKHQVPQVEHHLLVSLADGQIVALDEDTGRKVWSIDTGSPLVASSTDAERRAGDDVHSGEYEGIFPSTDGSLYTYSLDEEGSPHVQKLPVTVKDLVDASPSPTPEGAMMLGSQQTIVFIIDVQRGIVLKTIKGDDTDVFMYLRGHDGTTQVDEDFFQDGVEVKTIVISRKDFVIRSIHPSFGEQWNVTWSQLDKMSMVELHGHGAEVDRDDMKLVLAPDYSLKRFDGETGAEMWSVSFPIPPTVAYPSSGKAIDLLDATKKMLNMVVDRKASMTALVEQGHLLEVSETLVVGEMEGKLFGLRAPYFKKSDRARVAEDDAPVGVGEEEQALVPAGKTVGRVCKDKHDVCRIPVGFYPLVENASETKLLFLPKCSADDVEDCDDDSDVVVPSRMRRAVVFGSTVMTLVVTVIVLKKRRGVEEPSSSELISQQKAVELPNGNTKVGRLEVSKEVLGYGSGGTAVYEGILDGRKVAVKRMLKQFVDLAKQEIEALIDSDEHPNVVRCFALEEDGEFIYLALERCDMSLADALETAKMKNMRFRKVDVDGAIVNTPLAYQVARDIVEGVNAVHSRGIVHRDLKPHNVLLNSSGRAKLSDMGLSKKLVDNQASFETLGAGGSPGWQAPEQLIVRRGGTARLTASVDVFSSGLLVHYCLTGGKHPYGESYDRDNAILKDEKDLSAIQGIPCAENLIAAMLSMDAANRPTSEEILQHPMWWTSHDRLSFLSDFSDRVEVENRAEDESAFIALESLSPWAIGHESGWLDALDQLLVDNLVKYRKYDSQSLRDLLRVIRNKYSHYRELPRDLQKVLGDIPDGFLSYFEKRFPKLVTTCFSFALKWYSGDAIFEKYFDSAKAKGLLDTCAPPQIRDPKVREAALEEARARIEAKKKEMRTILQDHAQQMVNNGTPNHTARTPEKPQYQPSPLLPRRPWMTPCDFYIKTGTCKFGADCRFDHPPEHQVALNEFGLPIRPGEPKCNHFERTMTCKYGAACKYDHSLSTT